MSAQAAPVIAAPPSPAPAEAPTSPPAAGSEAPAAPAAAPAQGRLSFIGDAAAEAAGKKADGEPAKPADEPKGAESPAEAGLEIKLPEGMQADPESIKEFSVFAKELGLTSEQASKAAAWNVERLSRQAEADKTVLEAQGKAWAEELAKDPEFGGANLDKSKQEVARAWRRFGDPELASWLEAVKLDNHPGLVKLMARIGHAIADDDSATPGGGRPQVSDERRRLMSEYPSMFNADGSPK